MGPRSNDTHARRVVPRNTLSAALRHLARWQALGLLRHERVTFHPLMARRVLCGLPISLAPCAGRLADVRHLDVGLPVLCRPAPGSPRLPVPRAFSRCLSGRVFRRADEYRLAEARRLERA